MTTKLMPYFAYDTAPIQAWLEDQAAKGRFFRKPYWGFFGEFDEEEPRTVRYRLEPLGRKEKSPEWEHEKLCRAMGWEYVCTMGSFHVWRCDDPEAPEFYTEPEAQAEAYRWLSRRLRWGRWIILGEIALLAGLIFLLAWKTDGYLARLAGGFNPLWIFLSKICFYVIALGCTLVHVVSLRRFIHRLELGLPQPHRKSYRGAYCTVAVLLLLWAVMINGCVADLARPSSHPFIPIGELEEPVPYVPLDQIDPIDSGSNDETLALPVDNWLTRDQWWVLDERWSHGSRRWEYRCETRYYRLWLPFLAKPLAESCLELFQGAGNAAEPVSAPGLDGGYYGTYLDGHQVLIVWRGAQVLEASCGSPEPLTDHLEKFAAVLEAFQ